MTSVSNLRSHYDGPEPSRAQQQQQAARQAALKGAQLAFPKHPSQPTLQHDHSTASNRASLVAGRLAHANAPVHSQTTHKPGVASNASLGAVRAHQRSQEALHLEPQRWSISGESVTHRTPRSESPSNIAAVLATARLSPQITHPLKHTRLAAPHPQPSPLQPITPEQVPEADQVPAHGTVSSVHNWLRALNTTEEHVGHQIQDHASSDDDLSPTQIESRPRLSLDTTSPTTTAPTKAANTPQRPEIVSPRPLRSISVTESLEAKSKRASAALSKPLGSTLPGPNVDEPRSEDASPPTAFYDAQEAPALPARHYMGALTPWDSTSARLQGTQVEQKPQVPEPRRAHKQGQLPTSPILASRLRDVDAHSETTSSAPAKAAPTETTMRDERPRNRMPTATRARSELSVPKRNKSDSPAVLPGPPIVARKVTPHLTGDSLANAMVAGSLASSRAPSPTKSPGPGFHNKQPDRHRLSLPFISRDGDLRTPSPAKTMRHTMRRRPSSSEDEGEQSPRKSSRKFLIRKHPHKHHEGDRKRWRDELTARERKRYEGLWAANRGYYVPESAPNASESVAGLVVRDIWRRSRLPDHVLEEVWELVDTEKSGWLGRAEFIVGLWLVDQRLKGRKLPVRVQPTVWRSARGIHGIKIKHVK